MAIQRENVKRSPLGSTLAEEGPDFTSADVDDVSAQQSAYTERVARKGGGTSTSRVALGTKANKGRTQVDSSDTSQETVIGDSALPTPWSPLSSELPSISVDEKDTGKNVTGVREQAVGTSAYDSVGVRYPEGRPNTISLPRHKVGGGPSLSIKADITHPGEGVISQEFHANYAGEPAGNDPINDQPVSNYLDGRQEGAPSRAQAPRGVFDKYGHVLGYSVRDVLPGDSTTFDKMGTEAYEGVNVVEPNKERIQGRRFK